MGEVPATPLPVDEMPRAAHRYRSSLMDLPLPQSRCPDLNLRIPPGSSLALLVPRPPLADESVLIDFSVADRKVRMVAAAAMLPFVVDTSPCGRIVSRLLAVAV